MFSQIITYSRALYASFFLLLLSFLAFAFTLILVSGTNTSDPIVCNSNFQSLQMFVSDTVTHQMFLAIICIADLDFTPHTPCSPSNVNFFNALSYLYLIGPKFPKECSRISSGHFQDQRFFTEESIAFTAVLSPSFRNRIFLS